MPWKIHCNPKEMGIDLLTMSSHKLHGPKELVRFILTGYQFILLYLAEQETGTISSRMSPELWDLVKPLK